MSPPLRTRRKHAGFTLVEAMVGVALGLLVVLALVGLLGDTARSTGELQRASRVAENGRVAMQILVADLEHAGYWGGHVPGFDDLTLSGIPSDYPTEVPDPCANWETLVADAAQLAAYKQNIVGVAVQGYAIPEPVPATTVPVCAAHVLAPQAASDVLIVRHVEPCIAADASGTAASGCKAMVENELYMQVARCGTAAPSPAYALEKYAAANVSTLFPLRQRGDDCSTAAYAEKRRFVANLYYVRRYAVADGDGVPTLVRAEYSCAGGTCGFGTPQPLVEGIQALRLEYGVDSLSDTGAAVDFSAAVAWADDAKSSPVNRGDGVPDGEFVRCGNAGCTVDQLANATAMRVYVLARSETASPSLTDNRTYDLGAAGTVGPFNDRYQRRLFGQTVRLMNVATRRETP